MLFQTTTYNETVKNFRSFLYERETVFKIVAYLGVLNERMNFIRSKVIQNCKKMKYYSLIFQMNLELF